MLMPIIMLKTVSKSEINTAILKIGSQTFNILINASQNIACDFADVASNLLAIDLRLDVRITCDGL